MQRLAFLANFVGFVRVVGDADVALLLEPLIKGSSEFGLNHGTLRLVGENEEVFHDSVRFLLSFTLALLLGAAVEIIVAGVRFDVGARGPGFPLTGKLLGFFWLS